MASWLATLQALSSFVFSASGMAVLKLRFCLKFKTFQLLTVCESGAGKSDLYELFLCGLSSFVGFRRRL